jgi:hypothetical protein
MINDFVVLCRLHSTAESSRLSQRCISPASQAVGVSIITALMLIMNALAASRGRCGATILFCIIAAAFAFANYVAARVQDRPYSDQTDGCRR